MSAVRHFPLLILAGGRSGRMGRDKATLSWGGTPLLLRVIDRLAPIAADVWVSARPGQALPAGAYRRVDDEHPGEGPLAGLSRGLAAIAGEWNATPVAVAACDYPHADPALFPALLAASPDAAAIVPILDGRAHPLLAVWGSDLGTACERALARGTRRVREVLVEVNAVEVDARELLGDAADRTLQNVNDPDALKKALGRSE
jgi:molybdopterin-guanine dinucleotide biosynthesis protein A